MTSAQLQLQITSQAICVTLAEIQSKHAVNTDNKKITVVVPTVFEPTYFILPPAIKTQGNV